MTTFSPPMTARVDPAVLTAAQRLCPHPVRSVEPAGAGRNSRLYRVETAATPYALKSYPPRTLDPRDRLGQEFAALGFCAGHDPQRRTPAPVAADREAGFGLYEWIEGRPVTAPEPADLEAVLDFARLLHGLRAEPGAAGLAAASEACLSLDEIAIQITRRQRRLAEVASGEPELARFLADGFVPALERSLTEAEALYRRAGLDPAAEITPGQRTLSPSDFGFHNALRRPDGRLVFLDFEYFGWDDPVRLTADFLWHPGLALTEPLRARFTAGTRALFAADAAYPVRLAAQHALVGLRWCMIVLNEFLPERWLGRVHAGPGDDRRTILTRQLHKARTLLGQLTPERPEPL